MRVPWGSCEGADFDLVGDSAFLTSLPAAAGPWTTCGDDERDGTGATDLRAGTLRVVQSLKLDTTVYAKPALGKFW